MRMIVCDECGRHYDFERDDFCPKCGAFNQPVKTWTTDAQGNVRRVDGVNEANHAGSFAHKEVHKEKRVRQAAEMDWNSKNPPRKQRQPAPPPPPPPQQQARKPDGMKVIKAVFLIIGISTAIFFLAPLIMMILRFFL